MTDFATAAAQAEIDKLIDDRDRCAARHCGGARMRGVRLVTDLALCVSFFTVAVVLEKLALRRGRDWRPRDSWPWALCLRQLLGRPWSET